MRVIVDRIEEGIVIVEADNENTYQLPLALCPDVREGDTIEINVIEKQPPQEKPHAIFERLRKNSKQKKNAKKSVDHHALPDDNAFEKNTENPD